jgi:hypothetical protein
MHVKNLLFLVIVFSVHSMISFTYTLAIQNTHYSSIISVTTQQCMTTFDPINVTSIVANNTFLSSLIQYIGDCTEVHFGFVFYTTTSTLLGGFEMVNVSAMQWWDVGANTSETLFVSTSMVLWASQLFFLLDSMGRGDSDWNLSEHL